MVIFTTDGATTDDIFKIPRKLDIFMNDLHLGNHFLVSLVVGKGRLKLCQIVNKIQLSNLVQAQLINPLVNSQYHIYMVSTYRSKLKGVIDSLSPNLFKSFSQYKGPSSEFHHNSATQNARLYHNKLECRKVLNR